MGNLKPFGPLAFERWGRLRPACAWLPDGRRFVPLALGVWVRWPWRDARSVEKKNDLSR